ncbi:phosphoribosylglycinamide formyltransferase [Aestuariivirga sp.]|uniref:phosphoribosylglycinamide formyltransferase n=1 Tax=Aestuariivirga sp. TaxID=2650926 RepID=UPI00391D11AF
MRKVRTAVLISGRGSNMMALVEAARDPGYPAEIACVVSNRADAKGLDFARSNGIPAAVIDHKAYPAREGFEDALDRHLRSLGVEIVALAGFMRVLTAGFIARWEGRLINIHPSLLPAYKGLHTHERALADGARTHGCSAHLVTAELDGGPVLLQAEVPVLAGDTPDMLATRVLEQEHRIYPQALAIVAERLSHSPKDVK